MASRAWGTQGLSIHSCSPSITCAHLLASRWRHGEACVPHLLEWVVPWPRVDRRQCGISLASIGTAAGRVATTAATAAVTAASPMPLATTATQHGDTTVPR